MDNNPDILTQELANLVTWQNRWLASRLDLLRNDLTYYLNSGEPCAEEPLRQLLHELSLTQQLVLAPTPLPEPEGLATILTPEQTLLALQQMRSRWVAQFPEDIRPVVEIL